MKRRIAIDAVKLLILVTAVFLSGCSGGTDIGNPEVRSFSSDQALAAYFADQYAHIAQPTALWYLDNDAAPGWAETDASAGEKGYSETNVQESGVDESDMVKTDGSFLYVAGENEVRIVAANPSDSMAVAGRIGVDGKVGSLYLYDNILVVLYTPSDGEGVQWMYGDDLKQVDVGMPYWNHVQAKTGVILMDVSDPSVPAVMEDIQWEGSFLTSRLAGGELYVISRFIPDLPPLELWHDGSRAGKQATVKNNKAALNALTLNDYMPFYAAYDGNGDLVNQGRLVETRDFLRPAVPAGGTVVSVVTLSLKEPSKRFSAMGFVADIHHVYVTPRSVYLIATIYQGDSGKNALEDPQVYETRIYQLDISGDKAAYGAEGAVQGHILSRFSLGEYNGVLHVATTTGYAWDTSACNHLFCLEKQDEELAVIGSLENLAPGERLCSARFIGARGFLETVDAVAPLIALDLSDPRHPVVAGELKIAGYDAYLHPLDEGRLLAVGRDAIWDNGSVLSRGLVLRVYDVADLAAPRLLAEERIGDRGTDSEALFNHKALTFWPERNLLSLPVDLYEFSAPPEDPWEFGTNTFYGLYVYRLPDAEDLEFLGRVDMPRENEGTLDRGWLRGIFIDDLVYAAGLNSVKKAEVNSIAEPFVELILQE